MCWYRAELEEVKCSILYKYYINNNICVTYLSLLSELTPTLIVLWSWPCFGGKQLDFWDNRIEQRKNILDTEKGKLRTGLFRISFASSYVVLSFAHCVYSIFYVVDLDLRSMNCIAFKIHGYLIWRKEFGRNWERKLEQLVCSLKSETIYVYSRFGSCLWPGHFLVVALDEDRNKPPVQLGHVYVSHGFSWILRVVIP